MLQSLRQSSVLRAILLDLEIPALSSLLAQPTGAWSPVVVLTYMIHVPRCLLLDSLLKVTAANSGPRLKGLTVEGLSRGSFEILGFPTFLKDTTQGGALLEAAPAL